MDIGELRALLTLQDNFSGPINGAAKQLGFFSESFGAITGALGIATGAIMAAGAAVVALGTHGSDVADVGEAFSGLTKSVGSTADEMLGALRAGTVGAISDFDLMKMATKTLGGGLVTSAEDMKTLAAGARGLAKDTGTTTAEAFASLTRAMATGRTGGLAAKGLFVETTTATQKYAESLGLNVDQLDKHQKATAGAHAVLAALHERFKDPAPADFGEMVSAIKAKVENFTNGLSVAIAQSPVLGAGLKAAGSALDKAFGATQQGLIAGAVGLINKAAIVVVEFGSYAVSAADYAVQGFYGLKMIFNGMLETLASGAAGLLTFFANMQDKAAGIPGIGDKLHGLSETMRASARTATFMAEGFADLTNKASVAANNTSEGFKKIKGVIDAAGDAMRQASAQAQDFTNKVKFPPPPPPSQQDLDRIRDAYQRLSESIELIGRVGIDHQLTQQQFAMTREIQDLKKLKGLKSTEYDSMVAMIQQKYALMATDAQTGSDQIRDTTKQLTQDLILARSAGLDKELLSIQFARDKELQGLEKLKAHYGEDYATIVALVTEKFSRMAAAATGAGLTVQQEAEKAGFKTRGELEQTAATAVKTYQDMLTSGLYTVTQLKEAEEKAEEAKRVAKGLTARYSMSANDALLTGAQQVLGVMGEKYKVAAIAGATISTYQAIAKALASAPWPWSLALAAGAAAAGWANVSAIKSSSPGFAEGTPGTSFMDFGAGADVTLHKKEAVINEAQGQSLADMLRDAVDGGGREIVIRNIIQLDGRVVTENVVRHMPSVLAAAGVA